VSRYQKGKTNLNFTEARDSEWQWHPLGYMQVCISLQTDNHASAPPLSFLQAGCPSCRPTNSVKALKAYSDVKILYQQDAFRINQQFHYTEHYLFIYFASVAVALDSRQMTASSWSRFSLPSNFVNGHVSTMWFTVCHWPKSQEGSSSSSSSNFL